MPLGLWNLSFPARDQMQPPFREKCRVLTTRPPHTWIFKKEYFFFDILKYHLKTRIRKRNLFFHIFFLGSIWKRHCLIANSTCMNYQCHFKICRSKHKIYFSHVDPQKTSTIQHFLLYVFFSSIFSILYFLIQQSRAVTSWENKTVAKSWPRLLWTDFPMKDTVEGIQNLTRFTWHISELWSNNRAHFLSRYLKCSSVAFLCGHRVWGVDWTLYCGVFLPMHFIAHFLLYLALPTSISSVFH